MKHIHVAYAIIELKGKVSLYAEECSHEHAIKVGVPGEQDQLRGVG